MQERDRKGDIAGPVVQAEIVEPVMRPGAVGAVAEGHEHPKEEVQSNCANGDESDIGGKLEDGYVHGRFWPSMSLETARKGQMFHGNAMLASTQSAFLHLSLPY